MRTEKFKTQEGVEITVKMPRPRKGDGKVVTCWVHRSIFDEANDGVQTGPWYTTPAQPKNGAYIQVTIKEVTSE